MKNRQLPGRQEALRAVLQQGDKSPAMRHIAGLFEMRRKPPAPALRTFTFSSGIDTLTAEQRAALPF